MVTPDQTAPQAQKAAFEMPEELRHRELGRLGRAVLAVIVTVTAILVLNQRLNLQFFANIVILENLYLYLLAMLLLPIVFLVYPATPKQIDGRPRWYDLLLSAIAFGCGAWFASTAEINLNEGWEYAAPPLAQALGFLYWAVILEALRRAGGLIITVIVFVVSLFPSYADMVPGPISGMPQLLVDTFAYHILSQEGAFGIPMMAFGNIVVGFIIFGVALNYTGGAKFFNDIAFAMVGRWRGGAAQVGVVSSMLQGSISGSVISNVISSGVVTIPAMKRLGYPPSFAAAVEAVASTGAVLMPPVMGSTAFLMASFLGVPYAEIAIAAAGPGLLFYISLVMQIDAYSARRGLKGMPAHELPRARDAMKSGWLYILVFAVLVYFLLNEQQEALAPFYATGVLLVINQILPGNRMSWSRWIDFLVACARALAELVALLLGVGFIIGALMVTGLAGTLANDLVFMAGKSILLLLLMGAITSFIFGMGMTVTACYIFLAVILAPPLIQAGMDPLAVHLFIMYWGMVSFITPPVALAAFTASSIARAHPFAVGFAAMKLGSVIYFVPFFFVLNPALILHGTASEIAIVIATAVPGIFLIAAAMQGYLRGLGVLGNDPMGLLSRACIFIAGLALAFPGSEELNLSQIELLGISAVGLVLGVGLELMRRRVRLA
ncbi:TRAP transporter permease [Oceanibaculum pacificum]|uniref:C4-dicarboxylate ABC transporter n=1 Tax=Oceanibaculum pacificum TaxID=580166 RepID=A0A154WFK2_9PROT|nr:TRAP transporter fused permease subunit [Oceanibaculum pacificum]KZD12266.1 C4-dicarboxylate ABC transporter [Oceanibaculum pacificum]